MLIRPALTTDLDEIERVVTVARQFMRDHGNKNQWINGYPSRETYTEDIHGGHCFVITENETVHAVFSLFKSPDPTYAVIDDGAWLDDDPYICIHRIAGDGALHGVLQAASDFAATIVPELRADTHKDNIPMQNALLKCGYVRCGVIYVSDGSPREAFEKAAKKP